MVRIVTMLAVLGLWLGVDLAPVRAATLSPPQIMINQLQVSGGAGLSSQEFIELANTASIPLALDHWVLQYRSATAAGDCTTGWTTKTTIVHGVIAANASYLLAATGYLDTVDGRFAPGLADTKGAVRLVNESGVSVDALAWGGAPCGEGSAATAPPGGQSLLRGGHIWSNNNAVDFTLQSHPLPLASSSIPIPAYAPLSITEVLPSVLEDTPAYVELYNPNDSDIQLSAYGLSVGTSLYHLKPQLLPPGRYVTINLADAGLSPSANGDQMSLLDPSELIVDRTDAWASPAEGLSWALFDTGWAWTNQPTPAAANQVSVEAVTTTSGPTIAAALPVELTEVLPNPSLTETTQRAKFVELHNTGTSEITLDGFSLRSGPSWGNHVALPRLVIPVDGYVSLPATTVPLSLAVSGGRVGLFDATGSLVGDAIIYAKATLGESYAKFGNAWHWTTFATPGAANILIAPLAKVATASTKATVKKVATKKVAAVKVKATKKRPAKVAKTKVAPALLSLADSTQTHQLKLSWLLFALAGLTMAYVIYEFRHDLNRLYQFGRRNLQARRTRRSTPAGRRDPGAEE